MSAWHAPEMWKGGECWIIGGGPSIIPLFGIPEDIVSEVRVNKQPLSAFSPYMKALHGRHAIAINEAFKLGSWIDAVFFGDHGWYLQNREALSEFRGLKVSCDPRMDSESARQEDIKYMKRERKPNNNGVTKTPGCIRWNRHSGGASISLAAQLGVKKIYLLGFDMRLDEEKKSHWHGSYKPRYENKPRRGEVPKRKGPAFQIHLQTWPQIITDAKELGIRIIQTNPASAIAGLEVEDVSWLKQ